MIEGHALVSNGSVEVEIWNGHRKAFLTEGRLNPSATAAGVDKQIDFLGRGPNVDFREVES